MNPALRLRIEFQSQNMRVAITCEQQKLKAQHARVPDSWGSSEKRQDVLANNQLHLEQKKRAQKHRDPVTKRAFSAHRSAAIALRNLIGGSERLCNQRGISHNRIIAGATTRGKRFVAPCSPLANKTMALPFPCRKVGTRTSPPWV